jgi:glycosyltransferase involved in cell wall biosynthesis
MLKELNNVVVFGEVSHKTVADLLRKADSMVHPSFYETFGCVLIEAFASGIPVVTYDLPVYKELIVSGKNGIVANQMTPESLADAMEAMMSTIECYNAYQIRAEAVAKYSMPVVAAQFDAWYRRCLDVTDPASKD